ncbi:cytochrome b-c1 complex subunit 6, mitochondrial [Harpegnathos saltator]|uniref:Cytochrome b-c1 complex subunit 6 n=1 Tax=Harpegnathos saltator TaxID=610380 RepID=E2C3Y6_HARSA|nr:cytochrome b-c1 complex subunit 6, mitochondrial [Harpegnathos saltator]EFN77372.1 Cytochrome b-c1 complex subunit 6, mitochondrial [Harpegnathos saltator]
MSFIQNFFKRQLPVVNAEEEAEQELVDQQQVLRDKCSKEAKCHSLQEKLNTCNDRVNSRSNTEETCLEELIDYVECVDHCVAKTLFSKLK